MNKALLIIILITILIYYNSLSGSFLNVDDVNYIIEGPHANYVKNFNIKEIFNPLGLDVNNYYHPILYVSLSIDYQIWGQNPFGFHLTNLIIFIVTLILIYLISIDLLEDNYLALIITLLFAIHPIHAEPLCWITGRAILLLGLFCFTAFYFFILIYDNKSRKTKFLFYIVSLISFILSLFSHPISCFLTIAIISYIFFFRKEKYNNILLLCPFFILILIFHGSLFLLKAQNHTMGKVLSLNLKERIYMFPFVFIKYIQLMIEPYKINYYYKYPEINFLYIIFSLVLFSILIYFSIKDRTLLFCFIWMTIFYIPVSPIIGKINASISDRYFYLSSFGFIMFFSILISKFLNFKENNMKKLLSYLLLSIIIFSLSFFTMERINVWKTDTNLWNDTIKNNPLEARPYSLRGSFYYKCKEYDLALNDLNMAISIDFKRPSLYHDRGLIYGQLKEHKKALSDFNKAIILDPEYMDAYYCRAISYINIKEYDKAVNDLKYILEHSDKIDKTSYVKKENVYELLKNLGK